MRRTPSPSAACEPTTQKGPISTPSPMRAPSSMIAVGWVFIAALRVANHGAVFRLGNQRIAHISLAAESPDGTAPAQRLHRHAQQIAGTYRLAEARLVDGHEIHEALCLHVALRVGDERAGRLRHRFDDKYARHHRKIGKMTEEMRLVDGNRLVTHSAFPAPYFAEPLEKQERRTMGQQFFDLLHVQDHIVKIRLSHCDPACGAL